MISVVERASTVSAQLISLAHVVEMVGMSERTLYRMISRGQFPRADYRRGGTAGRRLTLWRRDTVNQWIEENTSGPR
jgi:predicted DNA-binding transcriptional regulator AlpA